MILRRLAEAISEQNWFTVVLEVMIVVVGIFIGLQVDGWNQDRKDRIEERQYLERLHDDLNASISEIESDMADLSQRHAQGQITIQVFENGALGNIALDEFERGIVVATRLELAVPQLAAIDELIASGNLGIIRNPEIRAAIATAKGEADRRQAYINLLVSRSDALTQIIFTRVRRYRVEGEEDLRVSYDFDELMADKAFQNALGNVIHFLTTNRAWLEQLVAEMARLRDLVATEIGKGSNP